VSKTILSAVLALATISQAQAEEATLSIRQGFVATWTSTVSFKDVMIGRPEIVDAIPQTDRVLYLTGKQPGITNLVVLNEQGQQVAQLYVSVIGRDINRVQVHSKLGNLHGYWAYECGPGHCARTDDPLAGQDRVPGGPTIVFAPQMNQSAPTK